MTRYKVGSIIWGIFAAIFLITFLSTLPSKDPNGIVPVGVVFGTTAIGTAFNFVKYNKTKRMKTNSNYENGYLILKEKPVDEQPLTSKNTHKPANAQKPFKWVSPVKSKKINFSLILMSLTVVLIIAVLIVNHRLQESLKPAAHITDNTAIQLLTLPDHPRIFDDIESSEKYYRLIGDDRIKLVSTHEYGLIKAYGDTSDITPVLYFTKNDDCLLNLNFMINDSEASEFTVDDFVKIIVGYLPDGFFEYYNNDSSYTYRNNNVTIYTYSVRLNEKGRSSTAGQYYYYLYFRITRNDKDGYWKVETGPSAYGDKGLEWIQKYADTWDIDLKSFSD